MRHFIGQFSPSSLIHYGNGVGVRSFRPEDNVVVRSVPGCIARKRFEPLPQVLCHRNMKIDVKDSGLPLIVCRFMARVPNCGKFSSPQVQPLPHRQTRSQFFGNGCEAFTSCHGDEFTDDYRKLTL